ncbi:transcription elongation factor GreA [Lujinxingia litoralis]|uniref:Transcription elongation factor GreA n=1 Tax=Lujinxingia litoralis TaxID=2211119 RepID=A0A328C875_9DELT|nr:transcription elongation factor GreA [Lujinxingia litoralis]RAL23546.1 transcription elongation factor GreA [Lujinxingia litoralis]
MQKIPMTVEGHRRLRDELDNLKKVERPRIVQEIEEARAHGDLKENAEYHAAKDKQGFVEGRIREIEGKLAHAQVVDPTEFSGDRVVFGAHVTVFFIDTDEEKTYQIVGDDEADIKDLKISFSSPIARALIAKSVGDECVIKAPGGDRVVEIMEVEFR